MLCLLDEAAGIVAKTRAELDKEVGGLGEGGLDEGKVCRGERGGRCRYEASGRWCVWSKTSRWNSSLFDADPPCPC